jgi:hypothetical protein
MIRREFITLLGGAGACQVVLWVWHWKERIT